MPLKTIFAAVKQSPLWVVVVLAYVSITPQEALLLIDSPDHYFLDVRETSEYEAGHIPSATLMPWSSGVLEERWDELPQDKTIVVYCRSGRRSALASQFLVDRGITNILNMTGGFNSYSSLPGAQIETGPNQEPVSVLHWMLY